MGRCLSQQTTSFTDPSKDGCRKQHGLDERGRLCLANSNVCSDFALCCCSLGYLQVGLLCSHFSYGSQLSLPVDVCPVVTVPKLFVFLKRKKKRAMVKIRMESVIEVSQD